MIGKVGAETPSIIEEIYDKLTDGEPDDDQTVSALKEKSPSCGCGQIYDGTFSRRLIAGDGVTVELFKAHGIVVCGESDVEKL